MFIYYTMEVLKKDDAKPQARQLAGIIFKNTILNSTWEEELEGIWNKMDEPQRDALKISSLQTLDNEDRDIIRAAATALTAICILEIPEGRWLEVIEILSANTIHKDN